MSLTISFLCKPGSSRAVTMVLVALGVLGLTAHFANGQPFTLTDGNSSMVVNATTRAAVSSWIVDGVPHLQELSNWYRIGGAGPETSAHTLALQSALQTGPNSATVIYSHPQFELRFDYGVTGGPPGSGFSRFGEDVFITNRTATPLEFHFFEYVDLDLSNTRNDDIGIPKSQTNLEQLDGQTIVTAGFLNYDHHEFAFFPTTLNHLQNAGPSLLNDQPPFNTPFGPGDVTWALQWDFDGTARPTIPPFGTTIITKHLECMPIPEPTGSIAAAMVFIATMNARRRR